MTDLKRGVCGILIVLGTVGCDGSGSITTPAVPVAPTPAATPTPAPSATPTPVPASSPTACPGECPVTNTAPAVRLTLRLYKVTDGLDALQPGYGQDSEIPVGFKVTVDAVAKDAADDETQGLGTVEFQLSNANLVRVGGNHGFQRKLTVLKPGTLEITATLDGVRSNTLTLHFTN